MFSRRNALLLRTPMSVLADRQLTNTVRDFEDFVGAARELAAELPTYTAKKKYEIAVEAVWSTCLSRLLSNSSLNNNNNNSSSPSSQQKLRKVSPKKQQLQKRKSQQEEDVSSSSSNNKRIDLTEKHADDIAFLWKECGSPALSVKALLLLGNCVHASSPMLRMQTILTVLASGVESSPAVAKRYNQVRDMLLAQLAESAKWCWAPNNLNNNNNNNGNSSKKKLLPHVVSRDEIVSRVVDAVLLGTQVAKEGHRLPFKDREVLLEEVHHLMSSCVGEDGTASCFSAQTLLGGNDGEESILPFCLTSVCSARAANKEWSERSVSLIFSWVTAFKRSLSRQQQQSENGGGGGNNNHGNSMTATSDGDKAIRLALIEAAAAGVPHPLLVKSALVNESSFIGLVLCVSTPALRPMASLLSPDLLRDLFHQASKSILLQQQQQEEQRNQTTRRNHQNNNSNNQNKNAYLTMLVSVLPLVVLYLPQIAPEVAGALAKQCSFSSLTNSSSSSASSSSASFSANIIPIFIAVTERFRQLASSPNSLMNLNHLNNKNSSFSSSTTTWSDVNADVRESVSNILLADLTDPSMTTRAIQLLASHSEQLGPFFAGLFNFGISDLVLSRVKLLFDRLKEHAEAQRISATTTIGSSNNNSNSSSSSSLLSLVSQDDRQLCRDLEKLASRCSVFAGDSNMKQTVQAERCCTVARVLSDPIAAAAVESLSDISEPEVTWSLFCSVHRLLANAGCVSSEIAQKVVGVAATFFQDEERLRVAIGDDVRNVLFLLLDCNFLSSTAKGSIAPALVSIVVDHAIKIKLEKQEQLQQEQEEAAELEGNNRNKKSKLTKKQKKKQQIKKATLEKIRSGEKNEQEESNNKNNVFKSTSKWEQAMPIIASALIRNGFVVNASSLPSEILPASLEEDLTAGRETDDLIQIEGEEEENSGGEKKLTEEQKRQRAKITAATREALRWLKELTKCDTKNPDVRQLAEPFVHRLRLHRMDLRVGDLVQSFTLMDKLGLTQDPDIIEEFAQRSHELLSAVSASASENNNNNNNNDSRNNNNNDGEEKSEVRSNNNNKNNIASTNKMKLSFVTSVAQSTSPLLITALKHTFATPPEDQRDQNHQNQQEQQQQQQVLHEGSLKLVGDAVQMLRELERNLHQLPFVKAVELGQVAGALFTSSGCSDIVAVAAQQQRRFMMMQQQQAQVKKRGRPAKTKMNEFLSTNNENLTSSSAAAAAVAGGIGLVGGGAHLFFKNTNDSEDELATPQQLLVAVIRRVSVLALSNRSSLSPAQAIGLLQSLSVSGVTQNSIFASVLAVVDQARKSAPLLEADVLALCNIVSAMSRLSFENKLTPSSTVDLDCARSAAQDALAQFLRFLVRSKSLDHVNEFGRLLDAVVSVLATTIDVHTMQALATSCLSRAHRGQLNVSDVESILRVISNRLSVSPHLSQQIARSVLPDLRKHVATKCFPTMTANAACGALLQIHRCSPLQQYADGTELEMIVKAFEERIRAVGKQLDATAIASLCSVYRDIQRTSSILQHVLTHLTTLKSHTVSAKALNDITLAVVELRTPHREAMAYLEKRLIQIIPRIQNAVPNRDLHQFARTLKVFSANRSHELAVALCRILSDDVKLLFLPRLDAVTATLIARCLSLLVGDNNVDIGIKENEIQEAQKLNEIRREHQQRHRPSSATTAAASSSSTTPAETVSVVSAKNLVSKLLAIVYGERRGSLLSNSVVVSDLLAVFDTYSRDVHPELHDLVAPRRMNLRTMA